MPACQPSSVQADVGAERAAQVLINNSTADANTTTNNSSNNRTKINKQQNTRYSTLKHKRTRAWPHHSSTRITDTTADAPSHNTQDTLLQRTSPQPRHRSSTAPERHERGCSRRQNTAASARSVPHPSSPLPQEAIAPPPDVRSQQPTLEVIWKMCGIGGQR